MARRKRLIKYPLDTVGNVGYTIPMINKYFETFFTEKQLPYAEFEIEFNGQVHFIDNEFVIELIKGTQGKEAEAIRTTLVKIDFANGDVNHFLRHLAEGYIKANYAN